MARMTASCSVELDRTSTPIATHNVCSMCVATSYLCDNRCLFIASLRKQSLAAEAELRCLSSVSLRKQSLTD